MFYGGLVIFGLISFSQLKISLLPDIEYPRVTIVTLYSNSSPEEVENLITRPISEAAGTVSGVTRVQSESVEGASFVTLQFGWGTNIDFAVMDVREKIDLVRGLLPQDASRPTVTRFDPAQAPFMEIAVFAQQGQSEKDLRNFLKKEVRVYLERIDGVALVQFSGGYKKEIQIEADQLSLAAYGLSLPEIKEAVSTANLNFPAGHITMGSKDVLIRSLGEYRNADGIKHTIVGRNKAGVPIVLGEVATITNGYAERTGLARYNGKECVILSLYKEAGKNTVDVSANVHTELQKIKPQFQKEMSADVVYDEARFISNSIGNLIQALLMGACLAFFALLLILRNLRNPLILLTILPTSILTTFIFMYLNDISLNMMSLGGLELGIGMLFDSGNVVLAAVQRHRSEGLPAREAALRGSGEVASSVTSAILTTVIVFLPIVFLKSIVGVVFAQMALTITISSLVSLVVSLTLIPMLCALPVSSRIDSSLERFSIIRKAQAFELWLSDRYEERIQTLLDRPRRMFTWVLGLFAVSLLLLPFINREFVPKVDTGEFTIDVRAPRGTALLATTDIVNSIEESLKANKDIEHVISRVGYDAENLLSQKGGEVGTHFAQIRAVLRPGHEPTRSMVERLSQEIKSGYGVDLTFSVRSDVVSSLLSPEARGLTLELVGEDLDTLASLGKKIKSDIATIKGVAGAAASMEDQEKEMHVKFDPDRIAAAGFSNATLADYLATAIRGSIVTTLHVADDEIDVRLQLQKAHRQGLDEVKSILVKSEQGKIHLSELVTITEGKGFASIIRSGSDRINRITADLTTSRTNAVFADVDEYLETVQLPEGYTIRHAGERENIAKSFRELAFALILSVLLIYMLLSAQFESFRFPLIMLGTIPMILIGIAPALALTGKSINVSSFTGIILLVGIVVDNASLFYEYVEILRAEGMELKASIVSACKICLRPILMNNGTTLLGMVPVALEIGEGAEFQSPLAMAVISGLIASVVISLFVIPAMFFLMLKAKERLATTPES